MEVKRIQMRGILRGGIGDKTHRMALLAARGLPPHLAADCRRTGKAVEVKQN